jgi:hypothetical protein
MTSHAINVSGLTASTTYYYIVKSVDASGNLATSTEKTFTTLTPADVTPPVISAIHSETTSTTATITWTTNEPSNSYLLYSLEDLSTATTTLTANSSTLVTSHSLGVTGLTASTTYHFKVSSTDASNNSATSTQQTFITAL